MENSNSLQQTLTTIVLTLLIFSHQIVWAAADDELFDGLKSLNATQLVAAVLERNADIPAMQAAWQAMQARIGQARAFDDPKLSFMFAPQTSSTFAPQNIDPSNPSNPNLGQKVSISQRIPWPGKRGLRADIAQFEADATRESISQARLRLTKASQIAYANWYFVHAALHINNTNQSLLEEFRRIAEIKYAAGRTSKQDVLRAEVQVTMLTHHDIELVRQRLEALATINMLLQRTPDAPLPALGKLRGIIELPPIAELRSRALNSHPELRALNARILANNRRLTLSTRDFYPDITFSASYNSLWNQPEKHLMVGAAINIPLHGKRNAAKNAAKAQIIRLQAEQRTHTAQLMQTVQSAYDRVIEGTHVLKLYRKELLPLAKENLSAALSDYKSGRGSFFELINAEKNLTQTRLQLEQARAEYQRREAMLQHAIGGPIAQ